MNIKHLHCLGFTLHDQENSYLPFCFRPMEIESKLQTQIKQTEEVNNQNLVVFPVGSNVQVIAVKLGRNKTLYNKTSLFKK